MKHSQEMQERLIKQFAFWRFQGEMIGLGFKDRGHKKLARDLFKTLKAFDKLWALELGEGYVDEVIRLAGEFDSIKADELQERLNLAPLKKGDIH